MLFEERAQVQKGGSVNDYEPLSRGESFVVLAIGILSLFLCVALVSFVAGYLSEIFK